MPTPRISIRYVMVVVLFVAIGLAAMKDKIVLIRGTGLTYAIMACILLASLAGAILFRGGKQVAFIAFAAFMTGYLLNAARYGTLRPPYLVLSTLFDHYGKFLGPAPVIPTPLVLDFFRQATNTFLATLVTVFCSILARMGTARVDSHSTDG